MHHYGWVKEPAAMQRKQESFHKMWHDDQWMAEHVESADAYDYGKDINQLARFEGTHPRVMEPRIKQQNWTFDTDISISFCSGSIDYKNPESCVVIAKNDAVH